MGDVSTTADQTPGELHAHLTGELATVLNGRATFELAGASDPSRGNLISADRARELARAFLRTYGSSHASAWRLQRGRPLDVGSLELSPRVFFAASPVGPLPTGFHPAYQRMIGPWYVLHFTAGGEPVLGVAVSALSTDLDIRDGLVHQPVQGGSYFVSRAVSDGATLGPVPYIPISPEDAVLKLGSEAGVPISAVPELVRMNSGWHPLFSTWKITLERPVRIRRRLSDGATAEELRPVREVYVGPRGELFVAAQNQKASVQMSVGQPGQHGADQAIQVDLPVRSGMAVDFVPARLIGEERG